MELNEIKKILYSLKPEAKFQGLNKSGIRYLAQIGRTKAKPITTEVETIDIHFYIPLNDIGDADFQAIMPAQLLIRYIVQ